MHKLDKTSKVGRPAPIRTSKTGSGKERNGSGRKGVMALPVRVAWGRLQNGDGF